MNGAINTYNHDRGFGFIDGDDGKKYFFHIKGLERKDDVTKIDYGVSVKFEATIGEKGPVAKNISFFAVKPGSRIENGNGDNISYANPTEFMTFKTGEVFGYEILYKSSYAVIGSTSSPGASPENAKRNAIDKAKRIGANALINLERSSGTGNEGNRKFTTHHYSGQAVIIGKRSHTGETKESHINNMDENASRIVSSAESTRTTVFIITGLALLGLAGIVQSNIGGASGIIAFGVSFVIAIIIFKNCCSDDIDSYGKAYYL
jgi:cold shock CspA family protein/uncharacterized protein YbjQ (UPF0145 family)